MAQENDIVLIYFEGEPLVFARIEDIEPDAKPDWYHVTLLMLQVPLQTVTWILRDVYINGGEFTMNGKRMRLEKVVAPAPKPLSPAREDHGEQTGPGDSEKPAREPEKKSSKVISLSELKKRK